jgi:hypothetical protein
MIWRDYIGRCSDCLGRPASLALLQDQCVVCGAGDPHVKGLARPFTPISAEEASARFAWVDKLPELGGTWGRWVPDRRGREAWSLHHHDDSHRRRNLIVLVGRNAQRWSLALERDGMRTSLAETSTLGDLLADPFAAPLLRAFGAEATP